MLSQVAVKSGGNIARSGVHTEVAGCYIALNIVSVVCTSGILNRHVCTSGIYFLTLLEFYLRSIINTGNTTEGKHQREVFCPLSSTAIESSTIVGSGAVVVGVYIYHIVGGVVVIFVTALRNVDCCSSVVEVIVHREVDDREA